MTINGLGRDTHGYPLGTMINYSQGTHSYYPVTASPVRQASSPVRAGREIGLPGYDGRMTTNSSTSRPAPADARATATALDPTARAAWLTARAAASTATARRRVDLDYVRAARVRAVLADCSVVEAL